MCTSNISPVNLFALGEIQQRLSITMQDFCSAVHFGILVASCLLQTIGIRSLLSWPLFTAPLPYMIQTLELAHFHFIIISDIELVDWDFSYYVSNGIFFFHTTVPPFAPCRKKWTQRKAFSFDFFDTDLSATWSDIFHLFHLIWRLPHLCVIARSNWWIQCRKSRQRGLERTRGEETRSPTP